MWSCVLGRAESETETLHTRTHAHTDTEGGNHTSKFLMPDKWVTTQKLNGGRQDTQNPAQSGENRNVLWLTGKAKTQVYTFIAQLISIYKICVMLLALRLCLLFESSFEGPLVSAQAWWLFSFVCTCNRQCVELAYLDYGGFGCLAHGLVEVSGCFPVKKKCMLKLPGNISCYNTVMSRYTQNTTAMPQSKNMQAGFRFNGKHCLLVDTYITALSDFFFSLPRYTRCTFKA